MSTCPMARLSQASSGQEKAMVFVVFFQSEEAAIKPASGREGETSPLLYRWIHRASKILRSIESD